jgi:hypothetical protein
MRIVKNITAAALVAAAIAAPIALATTSAAAAGLHPQVTVTADSSGSSDGSGTTGTPWE